jgi:hypothetical protein
MGISGRIPRGSGRAPDAADVHDALDVHDAADVHDAPDDPRSLAALHLRLGSLQLARAELEGLHAHGGLDSPGLADLAEVRWRMGDLDAAADAAADHLAGGGGVPIAHIIGAEAAAAGDREGEARTHVAAVSELSASDLDGLFAGMPRHAFWPAAPAVAGARIGISDEPDAADRRPGGVRDRGSDRRLTAGSEPDHEPGVEPPRDEPRVAALIDVARDDLASRDPDRIDAGLTRLALALRLDPTLAAPVVELLAGRPEPTALVTHGDALRILGRALGAEASYRAAAAALERPGRRNGRGS